MLKANYKKIILTSLITLLPLPAGLILWNRLPDTIAIHFDFNGQANGWSSKPFVVFFIPLFILCMHLLCLFLTAADPKRRNIGDKTMGLVCWIAPLASLLVGILTYTIALGIELNINLFLTLVMGLLFIVIGNYLPKCRQNYTVGIKVPWTLNDPDNWNRTHRFAGKLWIAGGVIIMFSSFLATPWILMSAIFVMAFVPILYSYMLYRRSLS